jgi:hypothetical protein
MDPNYGYDGPYVGLVARTGGSVCVLPVTVNLNSERNLTFPYPNFL